MKNIVNRLFGVYRGLPFQVYVLFFATVINGLGIFVYPFLTLYLTELLGYTESQAGVFLFMASVVYIPGALMGGKLADRFGRKKVLIISQTLVTSALTVCGFMGVSVKVPYVILLYLFFDGFADPARSAIQTDITVPENRQASFALTYLGHNLGYAAGPLIAGFLFYRSPSWLFWGNGIMGFLSVFLIILFVPETKPTREAVEKTRNTDSVEKVHDGGLLSALLSRPRLLVLALFVSLYGFAYGQTLFSLPLLTASLFGEKGAEIFGQIMSLNAIIVVLCNAPAVALLRKNHPLKNIVFGGILFALGFSLYAFASRVWMIYMLTVVWTLGEVTEATNTHYYIANNTPINHRGRFSAVLPIIQGSGRALAPLIGGFIITGTGLSGLWLIAGAVCSAAAIGVFFLYRTERRAAERT